MNVLITGGFGYMGGRLAQHIGKRGHDVYLGSRRTSNPPEWLPQSITVQTHWNSVHELEHICAGKDVIIHTAGMNAQDCATDPAGALEFNGVFTARLLQAGKKQKVNRFIYLSTAHVYGSPLIGAITEETCPVNLHPYATSHRAGEDVVRYAHRQGDMQGIIIRLTNAFGAPAHKDANCWMLLVNDLCRQAVSTKKLVLHSSGVQRRDFIALTDACSAIEHLMRLAPADLGTGIFNIGGAWSPTVWEMTCLIQDRCKSVMGFQPEIFRKQPKEGESGGELLYQNVALDRTGFRLVANRHDEIDSLLMFCSKYFA